MDNTLREDLTLLDLLKMGCNVKFPGGQVLRGLPMTGYILIYFDDTYLGCWSLNRDGLISALMDPDLHWPEPEGSSSNTAP